ncbi:hypothetical protein C0995_000619 [Termitomyces sp. Mi166|nr:hypothetical protein C0995_000619 [Termitomyces sp. Mi166\
MAANVPIDVDNSTSQISGQGETFMDAFDKYQFANQQETNIYYPFASQDNFKYMSLQDAALKFNLPDLSEALLYYLKQAEECHGPFMSKGYHLANGCGDDMPVNFIQV